MLAIKSNRIVLPEGIRKGIVLINDGKIIDVVDDLSSAENNTIIDAGNKIVMPGVIDPHVHINEPGRDWEGFDTATKAAIAGGLSTLVDMPLNSSPVTITVKDLELKIASTKDQLHTNVGFWGGVVPGNDKEIEGLIKGGVLGFKAFLTHSGIDEFPNATEDDLRKVMPIIAKYDLPLLVHCELEDGQPTTDDSKEISDLKDTISGPSSIVSSRSYQNYLLSRPEKWEDDAIAMMIRLCEEFNCRVHIVHLSSANSIAQIVAAKQKGLPITVETGQHYLYFTAEEIPDGQTQYKCAPPIREKANNEKLWDALKAGVIDFVATDHSPATPDLKELQSGNFMKAWGGIASLQFALPVLWTAAKKRNCTFIDIVKWLCENPAKLAGQQNTKGKIAKGFDADIIIVDDEKSFTVEENIIQHRHKVTPYLGHQLYGVVEQTFLAGEKVYDTGEFTALNKGKIILG
ncbi:MAG: allantoinase AllB [Bacteroidota bacterium]